MTVIKKAIVRAYDAGTHKAHVQIVGSHPTLIRDVRVATNIPAADVVAGRQCTVLFLDPSNQDDALILTIQGATPSGGGGGATTFVALTDTPGSYPGHADKAVQVNNAETALQFGTTWATLHTFSAGIKLAAGQAVKDSGGTDRYAPATSSPHNTLTGDLQVASGVLAIGNAASPIADYQINVNHVTPLPTFGMLYGLSITLQDTGSSGSPLAIQAIAGGAESQRSAGTLFLLEGLGFAATHSAQGGGSATSMLRGLRVIPGIYSSVGSVAALEGVRIECNTGSGAVAPGTVHIVRPIFGWSGNSPGTLYVYHSPTLPAASVASYHAYWGDSVKPHLRCDGANPPDAGLATEGDSPLWLLWMENGTLTSRRLRWRQQNQLNATDRVLIV